MISINAIKEKLAWEDTAPSILLVLNSFVWYVITYLVFRTIINELNSPETEKLFLFTAYFVGIAVSAIFGALFFPRSRIKFLYLWLFMGVAATFLLIQVSSNDVLANVLFSLFLGISIGVGLPSCLSYFADLTRIENRGFVGGIIWGSVGFIVLLLVVLINVLGRFEVIITLTIWRLFGSIIFLFLTRQHKELAVQKSPSYLEILCKKEVLLYLFPWVMFSIINFAEAPILEGVFGTESFTFAEFAEFVFAGIFALLGGIIADITGRKKIVIAGFVMLGIEYATLSIFYTSPFTLYLFMVLDGITWGLFFSVFFMAIWGDLGENHEKEKYYTLGGLPFLLANFVSILVKPYVKYIPPTAAFSFASFFLFLAVVPLMYAPETLPEKKIKERELRNYIKKAKKLRNRFV